MKSSRKLLTILPNLQLTDVLLLCIIHNLIAHAKSISMYSMISHGWFASDGKEFGPTSPPPHILPSTKSGGCSRSSTRAVCFYRQYQHITCTRPRPLVLQQWGGLDLCHGEGRQNAQQALDTHALNLHVITGSFCLGYAQNTEHLLVCPVTNYHHTHISCNQPMI